MPNPNLNLKFKLTILRHLHREGTRGDMEVVDQIKEE